MFRKSALIAFTFAAAVLGQQVGTLQAENHPPISIQECTASGCVTRQKSVVLDSNWRWTHSSGTNCYTGSEWNTALCPDPTTCASNCAVDGADYSGTYGITTTGDALTLRFVTQGPNSRNVGSRVYLMDDTDNYYMFNLLNKEFTFDVDVSNIPCGLNGALYFSEMPQDGGKAAYAGNNAGARYGTGYCDAQCPHDMKWINGEANVLDWNPSDTDANAGNGRYGACCAEMDIWEANSMATAYTPHVCRDPGLYRCEGLECGDGPNRYDGVCDKDGCDFNPFRMGDQSFYGLGKTVDTNQKMTVITQFFTHDNSDTGTLVEIRRKYVQNGVVYDNPSSTFPELSQYDSITDDFCVDQKNLFGDNHYYNLNGAGAKMGQSLAQMVLAMSLWSDHGAHMLWLDSDFPLDKSPSEPGVSRGECATTSGVPDEVEAQYPNASVTFSNLKIGTIGSTFSGGSQPPVSSSSSSVPSSTPTSSSSSSAGPGPTGATVPQWGQCGGNNYTGPTQCAAGTTCTEINPSYTANIERVAMVAKRRVWFITGASTGFGRLTTEFVLEKGEIAVATARNLESLQDLLGRYPSDRLLVLKCDVTKKDDIMSAFEDAVKKFGRVDVVFNNAGLALLAEVEVQEQEGAARALFEVNFWGAGRVAAEAVRVFRDINPRGEGGLLLNVSSALGQVGLPGAGFYAASKHALEGLTESLVAELDPAWNIKVSLIQLGAFNTRMGTYDEALPHFPLHPAYHNPGLLAYQMHQRVGKGSPYQGDTAKAVMKVYELSQLDEIPLYFPLGKKVVDLFHAKNMVMEESIRKFAGWSENLEIDA
ncbi:hypothetical protein ONZ45_g8448 [Pleurotus djamor]|nr:hypothetical protein ONZ45_g8448 [Pleurotus djamor]